VRSFREPDKCHGNWNSRGPSIRETDLPGIASTEVSSKTTAGELLTTDLLLSPVYRDTSVQPGHTYWYSVTASTATATKAHILLRSPSKSRNLSVAQGL